MLGLLRTEPVTFVLLAISLVGAISLHEYAHALAADLQGDRLPRAMGRLTPNPVRHLDPLGTLTLFLLGFGWGRPVEFRPEALRSRRFGAALVALAGPVMNLLLAFVAALVFSALNQDLPPDCPPVCPGSLSVVSVFLIYFVSINVLLAIFNLVPLPPLDGSRLLTIFLPAGKQRIVFWLDRYGFLILLGLVFFGGITLLEPVLRFVGDAFLGLGR